MKFKRIVSIILTLTLMMIIVGCGEKEAKVAVNSDNNKTVSQEENNKDKEQENSNKEQSNEKESNKDKSKKKEESDDVSSASKKEVKALEFETIPKRVAVGTVGITEIFDALEIDLVGIPSSRSYTIPTRYKDLTEIGMSMQPDMEILKSLDVDVFITDATLSKSLEKICQDKNIRAEFITTSGYDDIMFSIDSIGKAFGKEDKAKMIIDEMKKTEQSVINKLKDNENKKVMIIFGTPESFMLATDMSYIGDLANRLELENVTEGMDIKSPYIPFSIESVVAMNPDVILRFTHADPDTSRKMFQKEFSENPVWEALDAVKNHKVYDLDPHYFGVVANIRCAKALEQLYDMIYGE